MENLSHLKQISLEEFKVMTQGMIFLIQDADYINHYADIRSLAEVSFCQGAALSIALKDKDSFIEEITIVDGNCANCTSIGSFLQGAEITVKVGDPYEVRVTVEGYVKWGPESDEEIYLMLKTSSGNFILSWLNPGTFTSWVEIIN